MQLRIVEVSGSNKVWRGYFWGRNNQSQLIGLKFTLLCANKTAGRIESNTCTEARKKAEQLLTTTQTYLFRFKISLQTHLFGSCLWCLRQERAWVITQFRVTCTKGHTAPIPQSEKSTFAMQYLILECKSCQMDWTPGDIFAHGVPFGRLLRQKQLLNHLL